MDASGRFASSEVNGYRNAIMTHGPQTLATACHSELVIRKSRFIGCVQPIADRDAAQAEVRRLKAAHPGAAHVCWALLAGGQSAAVDDGEPGGTAGRPMLEVLRHQQLDGVLATVVRYFGGVKLGAGGLVRAYADTVAQALREAQRVPLRPMQRLVFAVPYELEGVVRREVATAGATLLAVKHGSLVEFELELAQDAAASFAALVDERSSGRTAWQLR